jgi:hypothetical protein
VSPIDPAGPVRAHEPDRAPAPTSPIEGRDPGAPPAADRVQLGFLEEVWLWGRERARDVVEGVKELVRGEPSTAERARAEASRRVEEAIERYEAHPTLENHERLAEALDEYGKTITG